MMSRKTGIIPIVLMTLILAVTAVFPNSSSCAENEILILVSEEKASSGEEVTVHVDLQNCRQMEAIQFTVNYDESALTLVSTEAGNLLEEGISEFNTFHGGKVYFAFACGYGLTGNEGTAVSLVFRMKGNRGSAVTVSDGLAWRYSRTLGESKAYLGLKDGGIYTAEEGTVPAPAVTPWIPETPEPSPSPEPTPEPEPTAKPEQDHNTFLPFDDGSEMRQILKYAAVVLVLVLVILGIVLIILKKKDSDYDEF